MSKITKKALEAAFSALLVERTLSKITVADIANKAGVNRHTFYYHYRNIDDLIVNSVKDAVDSIYSADESEGFSGFLRYVYSRKQHMLSIMHSSSREQYIRAIMERMYIYVGNYVDAHYPDSASTDYERDFVIRFYLHGMIGIFIDWMDGGMVDPPEKISEVLHKVLKNASAV